MKRYNGSGGGARIARVERAQLIDVYFTAYDAYDEICVGGHAKEGHRATIGGGDTDQMGLASDNSVIPLGSKVVIPKLGTLTVDDTGGAMRDAAAGRNPKLNGGNPSYLMDIRVPPNYRKGVSKEEARAEAHQVAGKMGLMHMTVCVIPPGADPGPCDELLKM